MEHRGYKLAANVSMLFTELPYVDRFQAARAAGFKYVETWWPFATPQPASDDVDRLVRVVEDSEMSLVALNLYAGDIPRGDRGIAGNPDRQDELRQSASTARHIAEQTGCRLFNLLPGRFSPRWTERYQRECARRSIEYVSHVFADVGGHLMLEPLTSAMVGAYPFRTHRDVIEELDGPLGGLDNIGLLFDIYHLTNNGVQAVQAASESGDYIIHVQIADSPGRHEPGTGRLPIIATLDALHDAGFKGIVSCDLTWLTFAVPG